MKRCCRCGVKKEDDYTICHQCELEIENAIRSKRECIESEVNYEKEIEDQCNS